MMEWGSLADWFGALGGLLAVIAAVVSWRTSERLVRLERNRDLKQEIAGERNQAERIAVIGVELVNRPNSEKYGIMVFNGSNAPVFDMVIASQRLDGKSKNNKLELGILPPGQYIIPSNPDYKWGAVIDQKIAQESIQLFTKGRAGKMITRVEFTDASLRKWELKEGRDLQRVTDKAD